MKGQTVKFLDWDTSFFGYRVASVSCENINKTDMQEVMDKLISGNFRLAYVFVNHDDHNSNLLLKDHSAILADEKVTFHMDVQERLFNGSVEFIEPYNLNYTSDKLLSLALQSGEYSRFRIDPNFRNDEFLKLYTEWINRSVSKEIADEILVYNDNNSLQGFITLKIVNNIGSIGLIAVDELSRGRSVGKKLVSAATSYFKSKNVTDVEVVTQLANKSACSFYLSCGFKIKHIINIYHIWMK